MENVISFGDRPNISAAVFEEKFQDDRFILFAPDYPGLPVLVPDHVRELFRKFDGKKTVSEVLGPSSTDPVVLSTVGYLLENGYLRLEPSSLPYTLPPFPNSAPPEIEVWLHLTDTCNLQCDYCFVSKKNPVVISADTLRRIAQLLAETARTNELQKVTVKFAGGEPTLALSQAEWFRSELRALFAGSGTKTAFAVLTNGTVMNRKTLEFLQAPDTSLTISLDGEGRAHDTFRVFRRTGRGSWDVIQRSLEILDSKGIKPFIAATISSETCYSLPGLLRWINTRGYKARLNVVRQVDGLWERNSDTDRAYLQVCERLIEAFGRAFEELKNPNYSYEFVSRLRICDLHFDRPVLMACGIGYNHIVVKPDGRIVSCPMTIDERGIAPGNDLLDACRRSFTYRPSGRDPQAECLGCRWFPVCTGGCPITNLRLNGDPFSKSPFCALYKYLIPAYIRLLAYKMSQSELQRRQI